MAALDHGDYAAALRAFGNSVSPRAIIVISAHWEAGGVRIASAEHPHLVYDFGGFPQPLYEMKYDAPGSPQLADEIAQRLAASGVQAELDPTRGWDHGVWIPLRLMFPEAKIPVVEVSLPMRATPQELYEVGKALEPFRGDDILVMGSGGLVHNLRFFRGGAERDAPVDAWAAEFESWVAARIREREHAALFNFATTAPNARLAVPTPEHFAPLFVVLGAAGDYDEVQTIYDRFEYANMGMHCFALR